MVSFSFIGFAIFMKPILFIFIQPQLRSSEGEIFEATLRPPSAGPQALAPAAGDRLQTASLASRPLFLIFFFVSPLEPWDKKCEKMNNDKENRSKTKWYKNGKNMLFSN